MRLARPLALQHPERIHPALWRGSQLALARPNTVSTGFAVLNQQLPGNGWPLSVLIELCLSQNGIGEISLLRTALAQLDPDRSIALVHPPYVPHFHCWANWQLHKHRLLWVNPKSPADALWSSEQILKHNACSALICWDANVRPEALRRLHVLAQKSNTLFIFMRPQTAAQHPSAAPLRLSLKPISQGLEISIIKRQGPSCNQPIPITLYPTRSYMATSPSHVTLDQSLPSQPQPGRAISTMAH